MLSFNHQHYVPILKTKAGERWALSALKTTSRKNITPLLELHPHKKNSVSIHAQDIGEALASAWGTDQQFFLDMRYAGSGDDTIADIFSVMRGLKLLAIPVAIPGQTPHELKALSGIIKKDNRGVLIRATRTDFSTTIAFASKVDPLVTSLGIACKDAVLMLDYRSAPMNISHHIINVTNLAQWSALIASSGAFPRSVLDLDSDSWYEIERSDWISWIDGLDKKPPRKPAFSDYLIKDPGAPASGGSPLVNLRYTHDDHWAVQRDGKFKDGMAYKMRSICSSLKKLPEWQGAGFSTGDVFISDCAAGAVGPGNPQSWLQWGMNHHMEYVIKQIKSVAP